MTPTSTIMIEAEALFDISRWRSGRHQVHALIHTFNEKRLLDSLIDDKLVSDKLIVNLERG